MARIFYMMLVFMLAILMKNLTAQQVDYSGTSAANFLKIGVGARPMAMGDAAISTISDPTALYWNVAGITRIEEKTALVISSMNWLVDTRHSYLGAILNLGVLGSVGLDMQYLDYGKVEETTVYDQDGTGRFFSASDIAVGLGYARKLTERFSFGAKVKYIYEELANTSADAFGIDVGAVFQTSFYDNNLRLAATLSNFGAKMQFEGRDLSVTYVVPGSPSNKQIPANLATIDWEIPLLFRFGASNYFIKNENWSALLGYDVLDSRDYDVRHNLGAEVGYRNTFFLRGGYKFNYDEVKYTAGLGFDLHPFIGYKIKLDYVFLDYGVFGAMNQFTFIINM
jgi:hypothetical protein